MKELRCAGPRFAASLVAFALAALIAVCFAPGKACADEWVSLEESGFEYNVFYGHVEITGHSGTGSLNARIPASLGGTPVTSLSIGSWNNLPDTSFDVSACDALESFSCLFAPGASVVGLQECTSLVTIELGQGMSVLPDPERIDFSNLSWLENLSIGECGVKRVDLTGCASLRRLFLAGNCLTALDVTNLGRLQFLNVKNNFLAETSGLVDLFGAGNVLPQKTYTAKSQFSDVSPDDWYMQACVVPYVVEHDLMGGYGDGRFGPYDTVTRGQVATVLWRLAGEPYSKASPFYDVDYTQYYGPAINWARSTGVISGYQDEPGVYRRFGPDDPVTREQLAAMMANYATCIAGVNTASDGVQLAGMPDADFVSPWARPTLAWAMDAGLISGEVTYPGVSYLNPSGTAQRCALAKMVSALDSRVI